MDTLQELSKNMNGVPTGFWISITLILFAVLIWIVQRYLDNIADTFKELKENVQKLTQMVALHEKDITENTNDIKELQRSAANRRK